MVREVNPKIHVNERDYPVDGHHCDDPEKAKLVRKLALLITDLAGLHAGLNPSTGDFSLMASGYRLENGKKTTFVNGITVSGNFYELLKSIRLIGKDLDFGGFPHGFTRFGSPSIYVGKMPVACK